MRFLLTALVALLCCPAVAAAAPFAELPFVPIGADRVATCLQGAGAGRVAVVPQADDGRETVELLRVGAGGTLRSEDAMSLAPSFECPAAAAAASGAAVVAGDVYRPESGVFVAVRDAGGVLGTPVRVRRPDGVLSVSGVDAAIASSGAAVVSWVERRQVPGDRLDRSRLMAIRRAPGGAFGPAETVREDVEPYATELVVGIDDAGRVTIAWAGEQGYGDVVRVATAAPGVPFGAPQRLARSASFLAAPALVVADDGTVLLAYEQGFDSARVRVYERAPGAVRITPGPRYPAGESRGAMSPVAAVASGGGAIVAWLHWSDDDRGGASVEAALRAPGGAFQPPQVLGARVPGAPGWTPSAPLPTFEAADETDALSAAVGVDGRVVLGWKEEPVIAGGDHPIRVAMAAGTLIGGWEGATLLGGPGRSADGLAAVAGPGAMLWIDNLPDTDLGIELPGTGGRLHRALAGVALADVPPPAVTLGARSQRVRHDEPVLVTARCSAACDLRAVAGLDRALGEPAGVGFAQLDAAGTARIKLRPSAEGGIVPPRGGPVRVTVHATAPGGREATVARRDVRVRHAFVPRPRKPHDVRVTRRAKRLVVTWRTAKPARAQSFEVEALRRRDDLVELDYRDMGGRGRTRFRAVLEDKGRARWVAIEWNSFEPRLKGGRMLVRVPR